MYSIVIIVIIIVIMIVLCKKRNTYTSNIQHTNDSYNDSDDMRKAMPPWVINYKLIPFAMDNYDSSYPIDNPFVNKVPFQHESRIYGKWVYPSKTSYANVAYDDTQYLSNLEDLWYTNNRQNRQLTMLDEPTKKQL